MAYVEPLYECGQVIDLRGYTEFNKVKMPDRIYIDLVYRKQRSPTWMYKVLSEQSNGFTYMTEDKIKQFMTDHSSKAYEHEVVQRLFKCGFRFVVNRTGNDQIEYMCSQLATLEEVANVALADGIYPSGSATNNPDMKGIWIKYKTVIDEDMDRSGIIIYK